MEIKAFRVTGRFRLGPGDTVLLSDEAEIEILIRQGIIEVKPVNEYKILSSQDELKHKQ